MKPVGEQVEARVKELEQALHARQSSAQSAQPGRALPKRGASSSLYERVYAIGVVPVPNYFLDEIMAIPKLPDSHFRVLLFLWRKTIGRGKTKDWVSLSQIQKGAGVNPERAVQAGEFWAEVGLFDRQRTEGQTDYKLNLWAALEGRKATVQRIRETLAAKRMLGVKGYSRRKKL